MITKKIIINHYYKCNKKNYKNIDAFELLWCGSPGNLEGVQLVVVVQGDRTGWPPFKAMGGTRR